DPSSSAVDAASVPAGGPYPHLEPPVGVRVDYAFPTRRSSDLLGGGQALADLDSRPRNLAVPEVGNRDCVLARDQGHPVGAVGVRSEGHTSELQSRENHERRLLLDKKKTRIRARQKELNAPPRR